MTSSNRGELSGNMSAAFLLLIHEYFGIDLQIIWNVIDDELPILLDDVAQILGNDG